LKNETHSIFYFSKVVVAEGHLPHNPKVKGLSPAPDTADSTGRERKNFSNHDCVQLHSGQNSGKKAMGITTLKASQTNRRKIQIFTSNLK
jgi:hypothetical protein